MSRRGTKISLVLFLLCTIFACSDNKHEKVKQQRVLYKTYSMSQASSKEYAYVWNTAKDSIQLWANNHLVGYTIYADHKWYLDSLICFNKEVDRCVMALSCQRDPWSPSDGMDYFYGAKIKGIWYFFFGGGHFILPRDYYQSDVNIPLSIEQFNQIAIANIFRGYLKKNSKNEWEINDAFFISLFEGPSWGDFDNQPKEDWFLKGRRFTNRRDYFEFIYLEKVKFNWSWKEK